MSVYRDKKEWNKWNEMVLASEHAKEDFNDFADDRAIIRADKKIQSLLSKNYVLERQLEEAREENEKLVKIIEGLLLGSRGARDLLNQSFMNYNEQLKEQGDEQNLFSRS
jgi:hypothetical protein